MAITNAIARCHQLFVLHLLYFITANLKKELRNLKNRNVFMVIAIIVFGLSGIFTAYTFIEPMLRKIAGFDITGVTIGLFFLFLIRLFKSNSV